MPDCHDQHLALNDLVDHSVIPDTKSPVTLQAIPKRLSVVGWFGREALLDSSENPVLKGAMDSSTILCEDERVVDDLIRHYRRRFFKCAHTCSCVKASRSLKPFILAWAFSAQ